MKNNLNKFYNRFQIRWVLVMALFCIALSQSTLVAKENRKSVDSDTKGEKKETGHVYIVSLDVAKKSITVRWAGGATGTYKIGELPSVTIDQKTMTLKDLKAGMRVECIPLNLNDDIQTINAYDENLDSRKRFFPKLK